MYNEEYFDYIMPSMKNRKVPNDLNSVKYIFRIEMANRQLALFEHKKKEWFTRNPTGLEKEWKEEHKSTIIYLVNLFLESIMNMPKTDNPCYDLPQRKMRRIQYSKINPENKEDIVWIKFTEIGMISVIGTGCDIYFTEKVRKETTSGRILQALNQSWDESSVLIFPLKNIPDGLSRSDIESGIGNYLIRNGIPILDYYSHNY